VATNIAVGIFNIFAVVCIYGVFNQCVGRIICHLSVVCHVSDQSYVSAAPNSKFRICFQSINNRLSIQARMRIDDEM
jgi:hypothetical protein